MIRWVTCAVCKAQVIMRRVGATIGAGQLIACPKCGAVFCEQIKEGHGG
jgi:uncharacterized C2H2 Zn-finger protein